MHWPTAPLLPITLATSLVLSILLLAVEGKERLAALATLAIGGFLAGLLMAPIESLSWIGVGLSMPAFTAVRGAVFALVLLPALAPTTAAATR